MIADLVAEVMADRAPLPPLNPSPLPGADGRIAAYYDFLARLVRRIQPRQVLELGTGEGFSAASMMRTLPRSSRLTTINHPHPRSADPVGRALAAWRTDPRLWQVLGDSRVLLIREGDGLACSEVDLLFIDSDHTFACVSEEWSLCELLLSDGAIICMDDVRMNDMPRFWEALPYDKMELALSPFGFGVFRYQRTP